MTTLWTVLIIFSVSLVFALIFGRFVSAGRGKHMSPDMEHADVDKLAKREIEKLRQERYRRAS
jgi:hypothetical protein